MIEIKMTVDDVDHHVKGKNRNVADRRQQFDKLFGG